MSNSIPRQASLSIAIIALLAMPSSAADAGTPAAHSAEALRQAHADSAQALRTSPFGRPLLLDSGEHENVVRGEVLAVVEQPMERLGRTLADPASWCEVLLLTPNVAACSAQGQGASSMLAVRLSKRFDQAAKDAYAATFDFQVVAQRPDYTYITLTADKGPVGTRDHRFDVEVLALDAKRSVLRMVYAYSYGMTARLATQAYLSTTGSEKIGFTTESQGSTGDRVPVGGLRGSVERNAMRYYLAIEARAAQGDAQPGARFERSLDEWLAAILRHPAQIGEDDPKAYRVAKLGQLQNARTATAAR